tara:strand:+ start:386 stop:1024 length:639 start_codon:yes stop_codon:yes gene_type:complete
LQLLCQGGKKLPNVYDIQAFIQERRKAKGADASLYKPHEIPFLKDMYFSEAKGISIKHSGAETVKDKSQFLCTNCKISPQAKQAIKGDQWKINHYDVNIQKLKDLNIIDEAGNYTPYDKNQHLQNIQDEINLAKLTNDQSLLAEKQNQKNELLGLSSIDVITPMLSSSVIDNTLINQQIPNRTLKPTLNKNLLIGIGIAAAAILVLVWGLTK